MKKAILIIGILLVCSFAVAVSFDNRDSMIDAFNTYKADREAAKLIVEKSFTYKSDLECQMDYFSEQIHCFVCYEYQGADDCITVPEDINKKDLDILIQSQFSNLYDQTNPIEEFRYTAIKLT